MKLYICWGTFPAPWRPGGHPCRNAYRALRAAGHRREVIKSFALAPLPDGVFNRTAGRQQAKPLSGSSMVPILRTDHGEAIKDSQKIADSPRRKPAGVVKQLA